MVAAEEAAKTALKGLHNPEKEESSIRPVLSVEPFKVSSVFFLLCFLFH